jgi:hypothetical protein
MLDDDDYDIDFYTVEPPSSEPVDAQNPMLSPRVQLEVTSCCRMLCSWLTVTLVSGWLTHVILRILVLLNLQQGVLSSSAFISTDSEEDVTASMETCC